MTYIVLVYTNVDGAPRIMLPTIFNFDSREEAQKVCESYACADNRVYLYAMHDSWE